LEEVKAALGVHRMARAAWRNWHICGRTGGFSKVIKLGRVVNAAAFIKINDNAAAFIKINENAAAFYQN